MALIVTNCREGEVTLRAPQKELDRLIAGLKGIDGVTVEQAPARIPGRLGIPVYNWGDNNSQPAFARAVAQSSKKDESKPTPIPPVNWDWAAMSKSENVPTPDRALVTN